MAMKYWVVYGILACSLLLAIGVALFVKRWSSHMQRKAPLQGKRAGHVPGRQLLERLQADTEEIDTALLMIVVAPLLLLASWACLRLNWAEVRMDFGTLLFILAALGFAGYGAYKLARHLVARSQVRDGWIAEQFTGMMLNRLSAKGCLVLHDLPAEGFNIDHVVIGPRAVFAIETKSFRKPVRWLARTEQQAHEVAYDGKRLVFPDFTTDAPLVQAKRQAEWLRRFLRDSVGRDVPVHAVVALPGWFIQSSGLGGAERVVVFSPQGRGVEFMAAGPQRLNADKRQRVLSHLLTRYPLL